MYYLECLLRVFLKIVVQIEYHLFHWKPIFVFYKNMKGHIILKSKRM